MAGEHPVVSVPLIRILDRVGVHVPAVAVPVHVHRAQHENVLARKIIFKHYPWNSPRIEYHSGHKKSPNFSRRFLFLKKKILHTRARHTQRDSRKKFSEAISRKPWPPSNVWLPKQYNINFFTKKQAPRFFRKKILGAKVTKSQRVKGKMPKNLSYESQENTRLPARHSSGPSTE